MRCRVEIDPDAGFCGGVIRAIESAENFLAHADGKALYCLGPIVHNDEELQRLKGKGLVSIDSLQELPTDDPGNVTVMIRAHGEPPSTYHRIREIGCRMIDCSCPVVLKLQASIRRAYDKVRNAGGQVLIFGKIGHAEVLGLMGQIDSDCVVFENIDMLKNLISGGDVSLKGPLEIFSQTTKSPEQYREICDYLAEAVEGEVNVHNTICRQVASRHERLIRFAGTHGTIVFVAGKMSSNGLVLSNLCKSVNNNTYLVESASEIKEEWFKDGLSAGISGATSTPLWLLQEVKAKIELFAR